MNVSQEAQVKPLIISFSVEGTTLDELGHAATIKSTGFFGDPVNWSLYAVHELFRYVGDDGDGDGDGKRLSYDPPLFNAEVIASRDLGALIERGKNAW